MQETPMPARALFTTVALVALGISAHAQDDSPVLEEVIISAEKIDRSIQDTTTSVSVTAQADIEALNAVDIEDVLKRVGNAGFVTVGSGSNEQFTLRGVPSQGVTAGTSTPVSTLFLDGAVVPNQVVGAAVSNLFDVDQVVVLRGAQSTVQGRNSLIGAIAVNTTEPDLQEWGGRARVTYGNYGTYEVSAAAGGPLQEDRWGARLFVQQAGSDGFVERADGRDGDEERSTVVRGKLLYEDPSGSGTTLRLNATLAREDDGSVLVSAQNPEDRNQITDVLQDTERNLTLLSARLDTPINDRWAFVLQASHSSVEVDAISDFDGLADQGFAQTSTRLDDRRDVDEIAEFRFVYDGGEKADGFFGLLWASRQVDSSIDAVQVFGVPAVDLGPLGLDALYTGLVSTPGAPPGVPRFINDPLLLGSTLPLRSLIDFAPDFRTLAAFSQFDFFINDKFTLTAGLRYEVEDATFAGGQVNILQDPNDLVAITTGNPALPEAVRVGLIDAGVDAAAAGSVAPSIASFYSQFAFGAVTAVFGNDDPLAPVDLTDDASFSVLLPKVTLSYDFTDTFAASFTAQKAYRPGGLGINPVQTFVYSVGEETSWNYEFAVRSTWLDNRISFNANVFFIDWEDQQLEVQLTPAPQDTVVLNVGQSELFGFEAEVRAALTDRFTFFGSLGYLDTEVVADERDNPVGGSLVGDEFSFAPSVTLTGGLLFQDPSGYNASVDVNYQGESQPLLPNFDTGRMNDARAVVNARLGWDRDNYTVFIYGANLLDELYLVNAEAAGGGVVVGDPRTFGIGFSTAW
ncbi:MAG: TonB-dependent receptor [Pseudomonadota bacterium]